LTFQRGGSFTLLEKVSNRVSGALNPVRDLSLNGINPALRGGTRNYSKTPLQPPAQPPAQKSLWLGERASLRGMSPSGAEPGPEGIISSPRKRPEVLRGKPIQKGMNYANL